MLSKKETYKYLDIFEVDTIKQEEMKEKIENNTSGEQENYSKLGTILKVDKERNGGSGLTGIEDSIDKTSQKLHKKEHRKTDYSD